MYTYVYILQRERERERYIDMYNGFLLHLLRAWECVYIYIYIYLHTHIHTYIYYRERERERKRENDMCIHMYIYIYIYICIHIDIRIMGIFFTSRGLLSWLSLIVVLWLVIWWLTTCYPYVIIMTNMGVFFTSRVGDSNNRVIAVKCQ